MSGGRARRTDPGTAKRAARSVDASTIKLAILDVMNKERTPLNGWEMSTRLEMATISVVPRLCPMRKDGWIVQLGTRPGPSGRDQIAYVITSLGLKILGGHPVEPVTPAAAVEPGEYARSIWPKGFTKPEMADALHGVAPLKEMRKQRMIEDTGVRRPYGSGTKQYVVWRFKPHQLPLPLEK